jgi:hypothetical protein
MVDWRTLLLGVAAFSATFAGGMLLSGGSLPSWASLSLTEVRLPTAFAGSSADTAVRPPLRSVLTPRR